MMGDELLIILTNACEFFFLINTVFALYLHRMEKHVRGSLKTLHFILFPV